MHWLRVAVLWVGEAIRGHGVGSRLLVEAQRMALGMGANDAAPETFEWQAPGFCEKHGDREAARMENCIGGFCLAVMRKALSVPTGNCSEASTTAAEIDR